MFGLLALRFSRKPTDTLQPGVFPVWETEFAAVAPFLHSVSFTPAASNHTVSAPSPVSPHSVRVWRYAFWL